MFKVPLEGITSSSQPKSSVQKNIIKKFIEQFPLMETYIEEVIPKGTKLTEAKLKGVSHIKVYFIEEEVLFYQQRDQTIIPHLKLLHKYPTMMKHMQCDKGAIKHIIGGSDVMAPGLLHENGVIDESAVVGDVIAIMAEGKRHAMAIGRMAMTPADIKETKKGIAIALETYITDALWTFKVE
ncbi:unnamed protein product [Moneuplotes crassus]|uniref:PUA domain-containing protein n=1 Tax=Euplotes crassus TaxID=5936 RepID=A0AAD1XXI9_EUPCR|nr:unnamed protein product [Moneuplotes crassus]